MNKKLTESQKSAIEIALHKLKVKFYTSIAELLKDEFEPTELFDLIMQFVFIAWPNQDDIPLSIRSEKFLSENRNKSRPAAVKSHLLSLNLTEKRLRVLLKALILFFTEAEKEKIEIEFSRKFLELEFQKLNSDVADESKITRQTNSSSHVKTSRNVSGKKTFDDIFIFAPWQKYLDALVKCTPQLIDTNYRFIGNKKTQRGVIASWFKYLKSKGIIDQSINREELAKVLSSEIKDFSISSSSIDNESNAYKDKFERQLLELIK